MTSFPLAIASTHSRPEDVQENLKQIAAFARHAAQDGADFLLTPEQSARGADGYPEGIVTVEVAGEGLVYREFSKVATETHVVLSAGFAE